MKNTIAMLLAGGRGSRLGILSRFRAKPAVPFGGMYRIIDFTLSNVMNSGFDIVGILTQYNPLSLMEHIGIGWHWDFTKRGKGAKILPPHTGEKDSDWYKGTADAIFQNLNFIERYASERVLILSGDHIYKMDYAEMLAFHKTKQAELTVAMMEVPLSEAFRFGVGLVDAEQRIIDFEEKPEVPKNNLVSMGIYIFNKDILKEKLFQMIVKEKRYDFGKDVITDLIHRGKTFAYPFKGYWRDVGTFESYWEANMDLLDPDKGLDIEAWDIRTNLDHFKYYELPPSYIGLHGNVKQSLVSKGCHIDGSVIRSILSPGVVVGKGAVIADSIIMENTVIEENARLYYAIVDKEVQIGRNCQIGFPADSGQGEISIENLSSLLTVIGKRAKLPPDLTIEPNTIIYPLVTATDFLKPLIRSGSAIIPADSLEG